MNSRTKTSLIAFCLASLVASPFAEAARMGKSGSYGMRRSAPTRQYQAPAAPTQPMPSQAPSQVQPQKKGVGVGTAIAAGAAGAAAGYMIGSAVNGNNAAAAPAQANVASAPTSAVASAPVQNPRPGIPWNLVLILGAIFLVGLLWFRRRMASAEHAPQAMRPQPAPAPTQFDNNRFDPIPSIGSGVPGYNGAGQQTAGSFAPARLPDGTETPYFLRQVKATFLHLQSLNSPDTLDEVRRYMTPELFGEIRDEIARNGATADFTDLDCQLVEATEEGGRFVASVRFFGQVSEEVNAAPIPFSETWHFVKEPGSSKWMVAGIQQN